MLSVTNDEDEGPQRGVGRVSGPAGLSVKQRDFARFYVMNGGKGREAAVAAGYGEAGAHVCASRCLVNPKVGAEIQRLSRSLIHSALPTLIAEMVNLATDREVAPRDRLKALNSLLERGGIATDKAGLSVQVGVQVNGQTAQALLNEVWTARQSRLSDIAEGMPDTLQQDIHDIERLAIEPPPATPGGVEFQGPASRTCPLPVSQTPKPSIANDFDA